MKEWLKKASPYIITVLVVCGILGYYRGLYQIVTALILWSLMIMVVEFSHRQPKSERRLIRIMTLALIIFLGLGCLFSYGIWSPANALTLESQASELTLEYEFENGQIIWTWYGGVAPYKVWDSNGLIAEGYPYEWMIRDVEPGKTYTLAVEDAVNSTEALTAKAPYYTFTTEIWILIALFAVLALLSIWIPYAAFACAALGGFLMLMIVPDTNYAGYLRIIAATLFIVGLGTIYIHGVSR